MGQKRAPIGRERGWFMHAHLLEDVSAPTSRSPTHCVSGWKAASEALPLASPLDAGVGVIPALIL
jgi:hypothetical protein